MLKKRLIGAVTIKNSWAVQSFGYDRYLPLGKPECLVENFDRWGADEILVQVIDRSKIGGGPDYGLLEKLAHLGLGTPLIYAGGISTVDEGIKVIQSGADRIAVDALLHNDLSVVRGLSDRLGAQAVIAAMPMTMGADGPEWFNYGFKIAAPIGNELIEIIETGVVSEVLLTDWQHEGRAISFDNSLIDHFPIKNIPLITFGGISSTEQMRNIFSYPNVVAVSVGNFLSYREHAIQQFKDELASADLRPACYASYYSLDAHV